MIRESTRVRANCCCVRQRLPCARPATGTTFGATLDVAFVPLRADVPVQGGPARGHRHRTPSWWSGWDAVAKVYDAVAESVLVEEFEVGADARREGRLSAAEDHGPHEQLALVDEARIEGPRREVRPAD